MKKKFSIAWKASKQTRKQRKYRANAPLHTRHKLMSSNLSKELRKKYARKSFPLKKEDSVKIMRGKFKGKVGKVNTIDLKKLRISVEGLQRQKKDGTKVNVYFNPSKVQIQELNIEDKERINSITKSDKSEKAEDKKEESKERELKSKKENKEKENVSKKK